MADQVTVTTGGADPSTFTFPAAVRSSTTMTPTPAPSTPPATGGSTGRTGGTAAGSGGSLATTGLSTAVPVLALLLVGVGIVVRRRRG